MSNMNGTKKRSFEEESREQIRENKRQRKIHAGNNDL